MRDDFNKSVVVELNEKHRRLVRNLIPSHRETFVFSKKKKKGRRPAQKGRKKCWTVSGGKVSGWRYQREREEEGKFLL